MSALRGNYLADGRKVQVLWREIADILTYTVCGRAGHEQFSRPTEVRAGIRLGASCCDT
jgi:hypothetical protein